MRSAHLVSAYSLLLTLIPPFINRLEASPLPPNIWASASANGRFLVVRDQELGPAERDGGRRILNTTFRVFAPETGRNAKDRLASNSTFWSDPLWQVRLDKAQGALNFWPLLSNDGQMLILVRLTVPGSNGAVLQIYRRTSLAGMLVRSIPLTDLWTAQEIDSSGNKIVMFTDSTPQWFAGGVLRFSRDGNHLLYRTQWNDRLRIDLRDGSVQRVPPQDSTLNHASEKNAQKP